MSTGTPYVLALQACLDRVTYKQGWTLEAVLDPGDGGQGHWCINLLVTHWAPNAYPDGRKEVLVYRMRTVSPHIYRDLDAARFIAWVRSVVIELEMHEHDEWFKVDGKHLTEPHPETVSA